MHPRFNLAWAQCKIWEIKVFTETWPETQIPINTDNPFNKSKQITIKKRGLVYQNQRKRSTMILILQYSIFVLHKIHMSARQGSLFLWTQLKILCAWNHSSEIRMWSFQVLTCVLNARARRTHAWMPDLWLVSSSSAALLYKVSTDDSTDSLLSILSVLLLLLLTLFCTVVSDEWVDAMFKGKNKNKEIKRMGSNLYLKIVP